MHVQSFFTLLHGHLWHGLVGLVMLGSVDGVLGVASVVGIVHGVCSGGIHIVVLRVVALWRHVLQGLLLQRWLLGTIF